MIDSTRPTNANEQITQRQSAREARAEARRARAESIIQDLERQRRELEERLRILNNENELDTFREELALAHSRVNTASERLRRLNQSVILESTLLTREQMHTNAGLEYNRARSDYDDYRNANPSDREGIIRRYDEYNRIHRAIIASSQERIRPLVAERDMAKREFDEAKRNYDNLFERRQNLQEEIGDLHQGINELRRELTQAQGKRRHQTRYKKSKRFINSKNRRKLHTLRKKRKTN